MARRRCDRGQPPIREVDTLPRRCQSPEEWHTSGDPLPDAALSTRTPRGSHTMLPSAAGRFPRRPRQPRLPKPVESARSSTTCTATNVPTGCVNSRQRNGVMRRRSVTRRRLRPQVTVAVEGFRQPRPP